MKTKLLLLFSLCCGLLSAQTGDFHYESPVPSVDSSGFYKIRLYPEITSRMQTDFRDLRLLTDKKETPYLLKTEESQRQTSTFREYEMLSKDHIPDSATQIVLKNARKEDISGMFLFFRNTAVQKQLKVSGSFDQKQWFAVKSNEWLSSRNDQLNISQFQLSLPLTNYTYYRIEIDDRASEPLDVIKAGYYESQTIMGSYIPLISATSVSDSSQFKTSWIKIFLGEPVFLNRVELDIPEPAYFLRRINIYAADGKHRKWLGESSLHSGEVNRLELSNTKAHMYWIEIINDDNPPLKISAVRCFELSRYLIAYLEKGKSYSLSFGDSLRTSPHYDLAHFEKIIPAHIPMIKADSLKLIPVEAKKEQAPESSIFNERFTWAVMIIVICLLGWFTYRMMKEVK